MRRFFYYSILIFILSIIIGLYYSIQWKNKNAKISKEESNAIVKETSSEIEKIGFNAEFIMIKRYDKCNHTKEFYLELPKEFINMTQNEIKEYYSDWNIEEFSRNRLILSQNVDSFCDEHYVVKSDDNNINIYHQIQKDDIELYRQTDISVEYLSKEDIRKLEEGIYIYGKEKLNSVLEDFE